MSAWAVYWILKLDDLKQTVTLVGALSAVSCFVLLFVVFVIFYEEEGKKAVLIKERLSKILKRYVAPIAVISLLIALLLPTTKQYLTIISVSYVTQNEKVITTADKLFEVLDKYLDKRLLVEDSN